MALVGMATGMDMDMVMDTAMAANTVVAITLKKEKDFFHFLKDASANKRGLI